MDQTTGLPQPDERFSALYEQHADALVSFCRRKVGAVDAEEVAQEAFLRAWASWDSYSPDRPFWPWLVTIARRICIDRSRRRETAAAMAHKAISIFDGIPVLRPEEVVEATEEYDLARAAVASLGPDQRRVLSRQMIDGWSYAQIADAEGVSEEAVRGVLRRARSGLRLAYTRVAGSAPVAIPIATFRWAKRRAATATPLDWNMLRAGEAAVAAAAAITIGAVPGAAAASSSPPSARALSALPAAASHVVPDATSPTSVAGRAASHTPPTSRAATAPAASATTVTTRPDNVKLASIRSDEEGRRICEAADIKVLVGGHGACVNTKESVEAAKIIVETGRVEP